MARKRRKKQEKWKTQLTYELVGLFLLIVALVTFARLGIVGEGLVYLFRFFLGDFHIILTIGLFIFALYLMVKRQIPFLWTRRLCGFYLLVFSIALWSHVYLFRELAQYAEFVDHSVIRNTWHLYWLQLRGDAAITEIGGGMIGALGFALSHFLFSSGGTIIFAIGLILTSIVIITGKSFMDVLKKGGDSSASFMNRLGAWLKSQWEEMVSAVKKTKMGKEREAAGTRTNCY